MHSTAARGQGHGGGRPRPARLRPADRAAAPGGRGPAGGDRPGPDRVRGRSRQPPAAPWPPHGGGPGRAAPRGRQAVRPRGRHSRIRAARLRRPAERGPHHGGLAAAAVPCRRDRHGRRHPVAPRPAGERRGRRPHRRAPVWHRRNGGGRPVAPAARHRPGPHLAARDRGGGGGGADAARRAARAAPARGLRFLTRFVSGPSLVSGAGAARRQRHGRSWRGRGGPRSGRSRGARRR